ncbi:hypothetical protein HUS23_06445 [Ectothiorhodospiraceae bacterium 2226]|nr:hypothetical protein HUS23_06445 [Ectothiorhodospiraceae bacterium 2226]
MPAPMPMSACSTVDVAAALARLEALLPLRARQRALPPAWQAVHRALLRTFAERGRPPSRAELAARLPAGEAAAALARLVADDLVVLDAHREPVGAYPLTLEATPHALLLGGHRLHAMCALDALSVAPLFATEVRIASRCALSGAPIRIDQRGSELLAITPAPDVRVGIHWQTPCGAAAHSLCREMVFLRDGGLAAQWQQGDADGRALLTPADAVAVGAGFFRPLLHD